MDGSILNEENITCTHKQVVNIYIVYEINIWPFNIGKDFLLRNSLFGAVKLAKNTVSCGSVLLSSSCRVGANVIIFGVDMRSLVHIDNKK